MRHRVFGKKFNRDRDQRKALFRNLVTSLIVHEQIKTTEAKAKAIKSLVDKVITKGKTGRLHAQRALAGILNSRQAVEKVIQVLTPRFKQRTGGFTRIIRLGNRRGDNAPLVRLELVDKEIREKKKKEKKEKKEAEKVEKKEERVRPEAVGAAEAKEEKETPAVTQIVEEKKPVLRQSLRDRIPSFIKRPPKKG